MDSWSVVPLGPAGEWQPQIEQGLVRECSILIGLGTFGVAGWKLRPFSPHTYGFEDEYPGRAHRVFRESDEILIGPAVGSWEDSTAPDDRVALRLIRGVYRWFGYEDDAIPVEFDQSARKLAIG